MQKINKSNYAKYFPYVNILALYCTTCQSILGAHTPLTDRFIDLNEVGSEFGVDLKLGYII